jgi:hypothetical protein
MTKKSSSLRRSLLAATVVAFGLAMIASMASSRYIVESIDV